MLLSQITRFLRQWRRYHSNLRELAQLGDRDLTDIGISRSDIPRIAWESSEREDACNTRAGRSGRRRHTFGFEHGFGRGA
jgi:uncharacterized protein YjiS (DUF1127 family)